MKPAAQDQNRQRRGRVVLAIAFFAYLCSLACNESREPAETAHPSVLLVVLDTVRADRVSAYGYSRHTTPQLDHLGKIGILFEDVTAPASWTVPSHASIFTGQAPWVHGAHYVKPDPASASQGAIFAVGSMRADLPTLASVLAGAGYRTVALSANGYLTEESGIMRGFETLRMLKSDPEVVRQAKLQMKAADARALFMFVNLMTAHGPYHDGPPPWNLRDSRYLDPETAPEWVRPYLTSHPRGIDMAIVPEPSWGTGELRVAGGKLKIPDDGLKVLSELYDAGVAGADFYLNQIVLEWKDHYPDGVVVVTSDHGEGFFEHGLVGHRSLVYSELTHVPLVIAAPSRLPQGLRVRSPVQLHEIYPTILELAGVGKEEGSLIRVALGESRHQGPIVAAAWPPPFFGRLGGRWSQVMRLLRKGNMSLVWIGDDDLELYDVHTDPLMKKDLRSIYPDQAAALYAEARVLFGDLDEVQTEPFDVDAEVAQDLKRLGYIQ